MSKKISLIALGFSILFLILGMVISVRYYRVSSFLFLLGTLDISFILFFTFNFIILLRSLKDEEKSGVVNLIFSLVFVLIGAALTSHYWPIHGKFFPFIIGALDVGSFIYLVLVLFSLNKTLEGER